MLFKALNSAKVQQIFDIYIILLKEKKKRDN